MLTRFNSKIGAALLVGLAVTYMTIALIKGHSARADPPVDLNATDAGVDVWRALALLVDHPEKVALLDVRPEKLFGYYKVPRSRNLPGATEAGLRQEAPGKTHVLLIAQTDDEAAKLTSALRKAPRGIDYHYLKGGAPEWFMALELPAPLFSAAPPPFGYDTAMATLRRWLAKQADVPAAEVREALTKLVTLAFTPDRLAGKKKSTSGAPRKKISGGCG